MSKRVIAANRDVGGMETILDDGETMVGACYTREAWPAAPNFRGNRGPVHRGKPAKRAVCGGSSANLLKRVPGEGIEPTLLSKLDFERGVSIFPTLNQGVAVGYGNFARSLQNAPSFVIQ